MENLNDYTGKEKELKSSIIVIFTDRRIKMKDVKSRLIEQINKIEDENLLNTINSMLNDLNVEYVFEFSDQQLKDIQYSIFEFERGNFKSHEEVMSKFKK